MKTLKALAVVVIVTMGYGAPGYAAPGDALVVIDSKGDLVGQIIENGTVARTIDGLWIEIFEVNHDGFWPVVQSSLASYYTSSNCAGQAYLPESLPVRGIVDSSNMLHFPSPPFQVQEISSAWNPSTSQCYPVSRNSFPFSELFGAATTFDLNSLNLIPPFRITEGFQPPN
jgi:hypothetical protein